MRRLQMTVFLGAIFLFFSSTIASAIDVPKWWIGPKDEYEKLVTAAKKEGRVVWWSHPDPACKPAVAGPFEKLYGIEVEHTEYTTAQIVQRVLLEGVVKMYSVDVFNHSVHHIPRLEGKGVLKKIPYKQRVRTVRDTPKLLSPNGTALIAWTHPQALAYNSKKVSKVPQSYEDMLHPRFKGKISVDTDLKAFIILAEAWGLEKTKNYLKRLGELKPKFHPSNTVITQMVASGEAFLGANVIRPIALREFKAKGAPVDWTPLKPVVPLDPNLMGVMSHAPHPNAAALFVYWMFGAPDWMKGMDECQGYGNALIPGNETYEALKNIKTISFGWEWGVRAAKEGWAEEWRKIIGAE